jgi:hypothetical protein
MPDYSIRPYLGRKITCAPSLGKNLFARAVAASELDSKSLLGDENHAEPALWVN